MKKLLLTISLVSLLIVGCGKTDKKEESVENKAKEAFSKVQENMTAVKNAKMNLAMQMSVTNQGVSMDININMDVATDTAQNSYAKMLMDMSIMQLETEIYVMKTDKGTIEYTKNPLSGEWLYVENQNSINSIDGLSTLTSIKDLKNLVCEGDIDRDGVTLTKYVITITSEEYTRFMDELGSVAGGMAGGTEQFKGDIVYNVFVDPKTQYVSVIEMDLTNNVNMPADQGTVGKMIMTMTFSDFNNVADIVVPQEIIDNAVKDPYGN